MKFDTEKAKRMLELKQLASDMCNHYVFTSYHIPEKKVHEMLCVVFPLLFASEKIKGKIARDEVGLIYEYMNKALPKSGWVDGIPVFKSFQWLDKKDTQTVRDLVNAIVSEKEKPSGNE